MISDLGRCNSGNRRQSSHSQIGCNKRNARLNSRHAFEPYAFDRPGFIAALRFDSTRNDRAVHVRQRLPLIGCLHRGQMRLALLGILVTPRIWVPAIIRGVIIELARAITSANRIVPRCVGVSTISADPVGYTQRETLCRDTSGTAPTECTRGVGMSTIGRIVAGDHVIDQSAQLVTTYPAGLA